MRRLLSLLVVVSLTVTSVGCYLSPIIPPTGALYTNLKAPQNIAAKGGLGARKGSASSVSFLGMIAYGDCSASAAARNGGVRTINHTDYEFFNVLGIYQKYSTVVYGD